MFDKYQQEIEEILKRAGEVAPDETVGEMERPLEDRPRALRQISNSDKSPVTYRPVKSWPTITPGKILMMGLIVFIITALFQIWLLIWVGLALLVVGYLLFFVSPRNVSIEKRWRGESIEDQPNSAWDRFKRWMRS